MSRPDVILLERFGRSEDILGGRHHRDRTVGVRWGYADPAEFEAAEATHLVDAADERRTVLGLRSAHETDDA